MPQASQRAVRLLPKANAGITAQQQATKGWVWTTTESPIDSPQSKKNDRAHGAKGCTKIENQATSKTKSAFPPCPATAILFLAAVAY